MAPAKSESASTRLSRLPVVFMLILAGLVAVPQVAAAAGTVQFVDDDRVAVTEAFGLGATVWVEVIDADLESTSTLNVLVFSTTDPSGELITLTKDGDLKFRGRVGFESSVTASNGRVAVTDGETVTARYSDASPVAVITGTLPWQSSSTATLDMDLSDYYGSAASAVITVTDADRNKNTASAETLTGELRLTDSGGVPISVTSTHNLLETGPNTGVFRTTVTLPTALGRSVTDGVTASGDATLTSATADFKSADVGAALSGAGIPLGTRILSVTSATDVEMTEAATAAATVPVTISTLLDGDTITATYRDPYNALGNVQTVTDTAIYHTTETATITLLMGDYYSHATSYVGAGTGLGYVRVTDKDQAGAASVNVNIFSNSDPTGISITATSSTSVEGEFFGTFGFDTTATSDSTDVIKVVNGNTVSARYTDARDATGVAGSVTDTATWNARATGTVVLRNDADTADAPTYDAGITVGLVRITDVDLVVRTVTDAGTTISVATLTSATADFTDADVGRLISGAGIPAGTTIASRESSTSVTMSAFATVTDTGVTVHISTPPTARLTSDRDPVGVALTSFTYVGSGLFTRAFTMSPTTTDANTIWAEASDTVKVTYTDAATAAGALDVSVTDSATMGGTSAADRPAAVLSFKTSSSYATPAPSYGGEATMYVEVTGYTSDAGPATLTAYAGSSTEASASAAGTTLTGQSFTLTKVGILATDAFRGSLALACVGDGASLDLPCTTAQTFPATDTLTVAFIDPTAGTTPNNRGVVRNTITWNQADDVSTATDLEFRMSPTTHVAVPNVMDSSLPDLLGLGPAYFVLRDDDSAVDLTKTAETVSVKVTSNSDTAGITVVAKERFGRHGSPVNNVLEGFRGQFTFSTTASNDGSDVLKVASGDTITITYTDPRSTSGASTQTFVESATWFPRVTGSVAADAATYRGTTTLATITVTDNDLNTAAGGTQTTGALVTVQSIDVNGVVLETETLPALTENSVNSGVFEGASLDFEETPTGGNGIIYVTNGATVTVRYADADDANGAGQTAVTSFRWYPVTASIISLNTATYSSASATATVTLNDPNLVGQATAVVQVYSNSDPIGETITVTETGATTGIFTGTFGFETTRTANNDNVFVATGDQVTAYFFDTTTGGTPTTDGARAIAIWTLTGTAPDTTAPGAVSTLAVSDTSSVTLRLTWTAPADDGATVASGTVAGYVVKVATTSFSTFTETANVLPSGAAVSTGTLAAPGASQTATVSGLASSTTYYVAVKARDEVPNYATISNVASGTTEAPDTTAPGTVADLATSDATATGMDLTWTAPADDGATASSGNVAGYVFKVSETTFTTFTETADVLPTGVTVGTLTVVGPAASQTVVIAGLDAATEYFFAVKGQDEVPNTAAISNVASGTTLTGTTTPPPPPPPPPPPVTPPPPGDDITEAEIEDGNAAVTVTVTRDGDTNVIEFDYDEGDLPADPEGAQVWFANSPYRLLRTLDFDDAEFIAKTVVHTGSQAKETTMYIVTLFYDGDAGLCQGVDPEGCFDNFDTLEANAASVGGDGGGIPLWVWILMGGALVLVILIVVAVIVTKRKKQEEEATAAEEEPTAAGGEGYSWENQPPAEAAPAAAPARVPAATEGPPEHAMQCPNCKTTFKATGTRPITTACPGCGKKGILR